MYLSKVPAEVESKAPFPSQEGTKAESYWTLQTLPPECFCLQIFLSNYSFENLGCCTYCTITSLVMKAQNELHKPLIIHVSQTFSRWHCYSIRQREELLKKCFRIHKHVIEGNQPDLAVVTPVHRWKIQLLFVCLYICKHLLNSRMSSREKKKRERDKQTWLIHILPQFFVMHFEIDYFTLDVVYLI